MSIRKDFPILRTSENGKTITYLDSAATTQKPTSVIAAVDHYYRQQNSNIHRAAHHLADIATRAYEHARELCRDYIGAAETAEIIFTSGTTASINLVAQALTTSVKPGQTIVISELEHHSNIVPWQMLAERTGAQIEAIAITDEGDLDLADARVKIDSRCALVAITHISNGLGSINPVDEIIQLAKQQDALTLVDGAQAALHLDLDVQALDCDFYVFSGHKLFAPTGIGILYGKRRRLEELPPASGGGEMIEKVTLTESTYQKPPFKFEPGTPNIAGAIGLGAAIEYINHIPKAELKTKEDALIEAALTGLQNMPEVRLVGRPQQRSAVISFLLEGAHPNDVGTLLDQQGVAVRTGHHCNMPLMDRLGIPGTVRASFSLYNNEQDVDALIAGVRKAATFL
tara:strand:- start:1273 stop:2472 length:1200 start_codon:yes stop_codon:yes gene_type:complete